uniref:Ionotropic receptor n=1 Tax=Histia rhodope TaxID=1453155 RepID=A0A7G4KBX7_9NEOP|nr:ionotropic receptor [Histia rhodope]
MTMVVFLFISLLINEVSLINPNGPTAVEDFTNCITSIVKVSFKNPGLLVFVDTFFIAEAVGRIKGNVLKQIHLNKKFSVRVVRPKNEYPVCVNLNEFNTGVVHQNQVDVIPLADYFVIIVDSYSEFTHAASRLIRLRNWNPHGKFLILLYSFDNIYYLKQIEYIFTCLFRYNVLNVVVLVPHIRNIRATIIYTWEPFEPPKYCGYYNETAENRIKVADFCEKGHLKNNTTLFENVVPIDMMSCVVNILAIEKQPFIGKDDNVQEANIERFLINEVLSTINMKTNYIITNKSRGERFYNEWNGALKKIVSKKFNVLLGGIFPDFDVHEDFQCSNTYLEDSYTWVVPRAHPRPPWVALTIIFHKTVWLSVLIGFTISALSWKFLSTVSGDSTYYTSIDHCLLSTWLCILGLTTHIRPKKESLRIFFVFFNIYCIIFITAYQTKLFDVLTNPSFEYQIANVEELIDSGLKFGGFEELHDLFYNSSDPFDNLIGSQWVIVENMSNAMVDVVVHRNFSVLCSRLELTYLSATMPQLSDSIGHHKYYAFKTNVFTVPIELIAMRGYALVEKFSEILEAFKQSGIVSGIRRHYVTFAERKRASIILKLQSQQNDVRALTIQHLQGGFLALVLGYVGGIIVFIVELIIKCNLVQKVLYQK